MARGETIEVRGTYDLETCKEATLALSVTATEGAGKGDWAHDQTMKVKRGKGEFILRETLACRGWPHLSFYTTTNCVDGVYFGQDEWLLKKLPWPHNRKIADEAAAQDRGL